MIVCMQKNQLHPLIFLEILQRYCKLIILGTLDMPGYGRRRGPIINFLKDNFEGNLK